MKIACVILVLALPLPLSAQVPVIGDLSSMTVLPPAAVMSDVTKLRAEAHVLRVQVVQLRAALAQAQAEIELGKLQVERSQLEVMLRGELKPAEDKVFDWATLTFKGPEK